MADDLAKFLERFRSQLSQTERMSVWKAMVAAEQMYFRMRQQEIGGRLLAAETER